MKPHETLGIYREGDQGFKDSPDAGDPTCLCSRCGKVIEEAEAPAIRLWNGDFEWRYHAGCLDGVLTC